MALGTGDNISAQSKHALDTHRIVPPHPPANAGWWRVSHRQFRAQVCAVPADTAVDGGVRACVARWRGHGTRPRSAPGRVQVVLKPDKQAAHLVRLAEVCKGVAQRLVAQPQQR